jgi:hypothetical protein
MPYIISPISLVLLPAIELYFSTHTPSEFLSSAIVYHC